MAKPSGPGRGNRRGAGGPGNRRGAGGLGAEGLEARLPDRVEGDGALDGPALHLVLDRSGLAGPAEQDRSGHGGDRDQADTDGADKSSRGSGSVGDSLKINARSGGVPCVNR